ncbi:hypothetical protein EDB86DRAFT_2807796 [Lactarius hatsudake]|nr:hypothetical protein EDB86DRAFT_2807796 [Lactarius hatsudake]
MPFSLPWTKENAQRKYIDLIKEASSKWANWDPPKRIQAGDFGTVNKKTGEFLVEGSIYTHQEISPIARQYPPLETPETDQYQIHSYHVQSTDVGADVGATAHAAQDLVFRSRWKFNAKRGAILLMFRPRLICVPDAFLNEALKIPTLKGKALADRVYECPCFYMYLSNKTRENVTISLRATVPSGVPGVTFTPAVNVGWLADGCTGVRQQAYRPGAIYTPLFCLKSIRTPLLRRDDSTPGTETWEETDVPWNDLDEDGASEPEDDDDDDDDDDD